MTVLYFGYVCKVRSNPTQLSNDGRGAIGGFNTDAALERFGKEVGKVLEMERLRRSSVQNRD